MFPNPIKIGSSSAVSTSPAGWKTIELITSADFEPCSFIVKVSVPSYLRHGDSISPDDDSTSEYVQSATGYYRVDVEDVDERYLHVKSVEAFGTVKITRITDVDGDSEDFDVTIRGHELDADTLALWRLDEAAVGTHAQFLDAAPGARHMATVGIPGVGGSSDGASRCRLFDGASQYGWVAGDAACATMCIGSWTVEAWVWIKSLPTGTNCLYPICYGGSGALDSQVDNVLLSLRIDSSGCLASFWEYGAGTNVILTAGGTKPTVGAWCHIAVSAEVSGANKTVRFYVDGVLQDTKTGTNANGGTNAPRWGLGTSNPHEGPTAYHYFNGAMKSMRVSNVVRTGAQIAASAAITTHTHTLDASTFALWQLNETPDCEDETDNGFHLVLKEGTFKPADLLADGGHGRYFDGASYYGSQVEHPLNETIRDALLADVSVEAWVRLGDNFSGNGNVFGFGKGDVPEAEVTNSFSTKILPTLKASIGWDHDVGVDSTFEATDDAFTSAESFKRHHLAWTKKMQPSGKAVCCIYVDGQLLGTSGELINFTGGQASCLLLGFSGTMPVVVHFFGIVDDVKVSSKCRTAAEVLMSYARGICCSD